MTMGDSKINEDVEAWGMQNESQGASMLTVTAGGMYLLEQNWRHRWLILQGRVDGISSTENMQEQSSEGKIFVIAWRNSNEQR